MVSAVRTVSTLGAEVSSSMTKVWNVVEVAGHAMQQEVGFARHHPGRAHDRPVARAFGEGAQFGFRLVVQADQAEGDDVEAERRRVEQAR